MTEKKIIEFFMNNGFEMENGAFLGTHGYAFLPFNNSLLIGKISKKGLLVEIMFKDSCIRKMMFDDKNGVRIDVREPSDGVPLNGDENISEKP